MATWDFKRQNVEFTTFDPLKTITAESVLIAAGRPTLAGTGLFQGKSFDVYPIGLVENFGLTMGGNIQRIFEIGSQKHVIIPGKIVGTATIARIIYDHHSLLRVLYAMYSIQGGEDTTDVNVLTNSDDRSYAFTSAEMATVTSKRIPGYNQFWLNLDSDVFRYPIGLAVYFRNKGEDTMGGVYLENCLIGGSQISINAGTDVLAEGVNLQFTECAPIRVADVPLPPPM
jgi:hypothetical protein